MCIVVAALAWLVAGLPSVASAEHGPALDPADDHSALDDSALDHGALDHSAHDDGAHHEHDGHDHTSSDVPPEAVGLAPAARVAASSPGAQAVVIGIGTDAPPLVEHDPRDAVVGGATAGDGAGWFVTSTGAVRSYGGAQHHGDLSSMSLNQPIVAMAPTSDGGGYWLVASDGGIFAFGDARYFGSTGAIVLARPIVDMASSSDDRGYLLVADDGGVFAFGSAVFRGSMGAVALNQPIVGISSTASGDGYRLVARDGGIFSFGDAPFHGSTGSSPPAASVVDVVENEAGSGYWLVTESAEVLAFGDAPAFAAPSSTLAGTVVAASRRGSGLWFTVHPRTPTVFAWQSGGMSNEAMAWISQAANNAGAVSSLSHYGTIGVHQFRRGDLVTQNTAPGHQIAFTARAVEMDKAAAFHGADVAAALSDGDVVMSRRSAALRDARVGDTIVFAGWDGRLQERRIGAVVADAQVGSSELTFSISDAASFGFSRPGSIWITGIDDLDALEAGLTAVAEAEPWVRWSRSWDPRNPDSVLSTVRLKELLGEFQYAPASSGVFISIDRAWVDANIVLAELPILGWWRCHRAIIPALAAALSEIEAQGLAHLIDVRDSRHGGCWVARQIRGASGGAISRHAWGLAVDLNPSTNGWGAQPTMDLRIVDIFRANGFAWGGTWTRPDGMHFEWIGG